MIPDPSRPEPQHTPKGNEHREEIGKEKHAFCRNLKVPLKIPEAESGDYAASGLCDTQVG
jgi:hypothetical protein